MPRFELPGGGGLRPLTEGDAEELYALVERERARLSPWMPWAEGQTLEGTEGFIRETIEQEHDADGFQVALVVDGAIAGVLGLHRLDRDNRATSLGYWLGAPYEGRGLMTA